MTFRIYCGSELLPILTLSGNIKPYPVDPVPPLTDDEIGSPPI